MTLRIPKQQKPFVKQETLTPLEKDLGVPAPGLYRPDGSFYPTRNVVKAQAVQGLKDALSSHGCTIQSDSDGLKITPPYPEGASRHERRAIDAHWNKVVMNILTKVKANATDLLD